ncbi:hypothetical protein [Dialister sp.]|jgi:hypothetical protein|uniref:hypothetical protein n=1 Tax=Dialister sp. TaxID=1955814 RepID=UPI002E818222|nr:hypothetical protein [Dialister sp.]MEE3453727.1 hypothetical protein [Dialister sp.]
MSDKRNAPVTVTAHRDGHISIALDKERCSYVVASLSQALCGSFDVAGEHENDVFRVISGLAVRNITGRFPVEPSRERTIH